MSLFHSLSLSLSLFLSTDKIYKKNSIDKGKCLSLSILLLTVLREGLQARDYEDNLHKLFVARGSDSYRSFWYRNYMQSEAIISMNIKRIQIALLDCYWSAERYLVTKYFHEYLSLFNASIVYKYVIDSFSRESQDRRFYTYVILNSRLIYF